MKLEPQFGITRRSYDLVTLYNLFNEIHSSQGNKNYKMHNPDWVIGKLASYIHISNPDKDIVESVEGVIASVRLIKTSKATYIGDDPIVAIPYIDWDTLWDEDEEAA